MHSNHMKYAKKIGVLVYACFLCYAWFCRTKFYIETDYWTTIHFNMNLIPFHTINYYISELSTGNVIEDNWNAIENIFGNIVIVLPIGYFLFQRKIRFFRGLTFSILLFAAIELIQLFTLRGICDIDDLILNTIGVVIGYLIAYAIKKVYFFVTEKIH